MSSIWFLRSWSRWVDVEVIRYRCKKSLCIPFEVDYVGILLMMTLMVMMLMTTMLMTMALRTRMTMWWDGDAHSCSPQGGQVAQLNPEHQFPFSTSSSASLTNIAHGNVRSPLLWCAFVLWCVISERTLDTNKFELKDQKKMSYELKVITSSSSSRAPLLQI